MTKLPEGDMEFKADGIPLGQGKIDESGVAGFTIGAVIFQWGNMKLLLNLMVKALNRYH